MNVVSQNTVLFSPPFFLCEMINFLCDDMRKMNDVGIATQHQAATDLVMIYPKADHLLPDCG